MNAPHPMEDRIARKIALTDGGCWQWIGDISQQGYGRMKVVGDGKIRNRYAHRVAYETFRGPLTDGLVLDHLCRNRACVNPDHLEEVTNLENRARGLRNPFATHCINGHEFTEENTYFAKPRFTNPQRHCRTCNRAAAARYAARRATAKEKP